MKNFLLAAVSGLLLSLGWNTWGFPLLLFVGFVPLLLLNHRISHSNSKKKGWKIFGWSYITFFIWNLIKTYWLWFSTEFGAAFAILVNSLLMALVFVLFYHFSKKANAFISAVFLTTLWISFEKMHLNWDFSWPWLNLGNGFSEYIRWIQWYEYTGTFGGTLWVWVVNFLLFYALLFYFDKQKKKAIRNAIFATVSVILPIIFSYILFHTYTINSNNQVEVIVTQPNTDPYSEKYNRSNEEVAAHIFGLAESKMSSNTAFVISPETVFASDERINELNHSSTTQLINRFIEKYPNVNFLAGISLYKVFGDKSEVTYQTNVASNGLYYNTYNSAMFLNKTVTQPLLYHKSKLVVGVESTPYVWLIKPLLGDIMLDLGGTVAMKTTQEERSVYYSENKKWVAAPIICYESVYGEYVTGYVRNGANFLAIITNDGWWDNTQGHKQHLSLARLRAIETRRDIARSANTGISAFINQRGEVTSTLAYNTEGALKGMINTNEKITFYVQYGDIIYRIALFVLIGVLLIRITKRRGEVST